MSANLEDIIQRKVHILPDEQQEEVLKFVENLAQRAQTKLTDKYPLTELAALSTDMGVEDLAANHDKYAHRSLSAEEQVGE